MDHVQIKVAETVGAEDRGNYYETVLRDMIQNHMFQLQGWWAWSRRAPSTPTPCATRR